MYIHYLILLLKKWQIGSKNVSSPQQTLLQSKANFKVNGHDPFGSH